MHARGPGPPGTAVGEGHSGFISGLTILRFEQATRPSGLGLLVCDVMGLGSNDL